MGRAKLCSLLCIGRREVGDPELMEGKKGRTIQRMMTFGNVVHAGVITTSETLLPGTQQFNPSRGNVRSLAGTYSLDTADSAHRHIGGVYASASCARLLPILTG